MWTWKFGEAFGHHYLDSVAMNHNSLGRGYETFGNATAETVTRGLDASDVTREWYRPWPGPRTFRWSMRDNLNYTETGVLAALDYVARHREELLLNFYKKGYHSWRKGQDEPPYAFVIPEDQGDRRRVAQMVGLLRNQRIEVSRAKAPLRLKEGDFPAGSYVVRLDQPYRNYAVDLLVPQDFPKDGGEPYDDISWALPAHFHLEARPIADAAVKSAALSPLEDSRPASRPPGAGPVFLLRDTGQEALLEAALSPRRLSRAGGRASPSASRAPSIPRARGSSPARDGLGEAVAGCRLRSRPRLRQRSRRALRRRSATLPRRAWGSGSPGPTPTPSAGSATPSTSGTCPTSTCATRTCVRDGCTTAWTSCSTGTSTWSWPSRSRACRSRGAPCPTRRRQQTPSHGSPAESDDITGGIGWEGLSHLQQFVEDGGLLVTLGSGSALALEGGIVRGVRRASGGPPRSSDGDGGASSASPRTTRTPGVHVRATFARPGHPLAYGYPARTHVFRQNFPVYETPRRWLRMAYCTSCLDGPEDTRGSYSSGATARARPWS